MSNEKASFLPSIQNLGINEGFAEQYKEYLNKENGLIIISGSKATGKTSTMIAGYNNLIALGCSVLFFNDTLNVPEETITETFERMLGFGVDKIMIDNINEPQILRRAVELSEKKLVMISINTNSDMGAIREFIHADAITGIESFKTPVLVMNQGYALGENTPPGLRSMVTINN